MRLVYLQKTEIIVENATDIKKKSGWREWEWDLAFVAVVCGVLEFPSKIFICGGGISVRGRRLLSSTLSKPLLDALVKRKWAAFPVNGFYATVAK